MILHNILIKTGEFSASLQITLWQDSPEFMIQKRPLILICPGGGYQKVSDREADPVAAKFYAMGYHTAILRYSVAPAPYPTALLQLAGAMKLIRDRANQWLIDTDKVIVAGFSAGGHLACSLGVFWREDPRLSRDHFRRICTRGIICQSARRPRRLNRQSILGTSGKRRYASYFSVAYRLRPFCSCRKLVTALHGASPIQHPCGISCFPKRRTWTFSCDTAFPRK